VRAFIVGVALTVLIAGVMMSTPTGDETVVRGPTTLTRSESREPRLRLRIGDVHARSIGRPSSLHKPTRLAVLRKTQRYVNRAIIAPLERGRAIPGWAKVFDRKTRRVARHRHLGKVTEVKMGFREKRVHPRARKLRVDAIGSPGGRLVLVAITWSMTVRAHTSRGLLTIRRHTELTFARDHGKWQVTAYRLDVSRSRGKPKRHARTAIA
jgi:hypothetical protein